MLGHRAMHTACSVHARRTRSGAKALDRHGLGRCSGADRVAEALCSNSNLHAIEVHPAVQAAGVKLSLQDGWTSAKIDWSEKKAVKALPATVALLLRNCTSVTNLNIRLRFVECVPIYRSGWQTPWQ